jgi:hypothetical protein
VSGRIAAVTAGWKEREQEDDELAEHLGGRTVNLELNRRAEEALAEDPDLAAARTAVLDEWRELRQLYNLRLTHQMAAVHELTPEDIPSAVLDEELEEAFEAVRVLDQHYLGKMEALRTAFYGNWNPPDRPAFTAHRQELERILSGCEALAVAGGHVGVLLDRLRLFDLMGLWRNRPVFAWSAGAMALAKHVVLFHDRPPQGQNHAEVLDYGLGLYGRLLPFPHARQRLRLKSPRRVARLARRFSDSVCVPMDEDDHLRIDGASLWSEVPLRRLTPEGEVMTLEAN